MRFLTLRFFLLVSIVYLAGLPLCAESAVDIVDRLNEEERHREGYEYLLTQIRDISRHAQPAELFWRVSRAIKEVGDIAERNGAEPTELAALFEEGVGYADRAIDLDPESYWGYYWRSANIARLASTQGFFKSIRLVKPMKEAAEAALLINPRHSNSYFILSIMYKSAPGWPIGFGNVDFAVSLCRQAIDLNRADYERGTDNLNYWYYLELARHLEKRNWSEGKRIRSIPAKTSKLAEITGEFERAFYYEGTIQIGDQTDKAEAVEILEWLIIQFDSKLPLKETDRLAYNETRTLLAELLE